jgi:hypothetical protein
MIFIKYRTSAHEYGNWKYEMLHSDDEITDSDKYRGCHVIKIKYPPRKWVYDNIDRVRGLIDHLNDELALYEIIHELCEENEVVIQEEENKYLLKYGRTGQLDLWPKK